MIPERCNKHLGEVSFQFKKCELTNRLSVRCQLIFQDYMDARKKNWLKPIALLKVTFIGEPTVDDGIPRREFSQVQVHVLLFRKDNL